MRKDSKGLISDDVRTEWFFEVKKKWGGGEEEGRGLNHLFFPGAQDSDKGEQSPVLFRMNEY
jgi:hypothetical protein